MPSARHRHRFARPYATWALVWALSASLLIGLIGLQRTAAAVLKEDANAASAPQDGPPKLTSRGLEDPHAPPQAKKAAYATDRLIVKYKDSVEQCVHCLLKGRGRFKAATTDRSDSLDRLHARFKIKDAKPVFRTEEEETRLPKGRGNAVALATLKQREQNKLTVVKTKFPQRTKRAPKNAIVPDLHHVYVLTVPTGTHIEEAVAAFQADPHVEYAQPDYLMEANWVPNDPYYSSSGSCGQPYDDLWGLKKIHAEQAWDVTKGAGIVVAVIDTGLDYTHPDIAQNVWINPGEDLNHNGQVDGTNTCPTPNGDFNCADDDANGYVDDVQGWNFSDASNNTMDGYGHGTHVSGTIAALGDNGEGVIGVAPQARIMPLKAINNEGNGTTSTYAPAIIYAVTHGADVLNNSWSCRECVGDPTVENAVRYAYGLGAVVVFSAGNSAWDVAFSHPQNMTNPKPIVVAASTEYDTPTDFTNIGWRIDVAAPGGGIPHLPAQANILSLRSSMASVVLPGPPSYACAAGTSMAAPHVTGVVALMLSRHPNLGNEDIRRILRMTADDIWSTGFDFKTGAGRVNAVRAVAVDLASSGAQIVSPADGMVIRPGAEPTMITGTASGDNFQEYTLWYRYVNSPEWVLMLGPVMSSVADGPLGMWFTNGLHEGIYRLKLVVMSTTGMEISDEVGIFLQENDSPTVVEITPSDTASTPDPCEPFQATIIDLAGIQSATLWRDTDYLRTYPPPSVSSHQIMTVSYHPFQENQCTNLGSHSYTLEVTDLQNIQSIVTTHFTVTDNHSPAFINVSPQDQSSTSNPWEPLSATVHDLEGRLLGAHVWLDNAFVRNQPLVGSTASVSFIPSQMLVAGSHTYHVEAFDDLGGLAVVTSSFTVVDVPLQVTSLTDTPDPFSPNGDGVNDTVTIAGTFNRPVFQWMVVIGTGEPGESSWNGIWTAGSPLGVPANTDSFSVVWDGTVAPGQTPVPDGVYTYVAAGIGASYDEVAQQSGTVTLTRPVPRIPTGRRPRPVPQR